MMAVRRVREGERPSVVIASYGLCRTSIYRWLRAERRGGDKALKGRKHPGRKATLSARQKLQVRRWISGRDPRQYGFDFGLWTRQIVGELIAQKFGIRLGVTAVGRLLAALDVTPQKPLRRAYERDPVAIEQWQQKVFPRLRARAKRLGAKLFFLDEAGVRSDQVLGRTWGLRGQTPEVPTSGQRQSVNAISAVTARGEFWFEIGSMPRRSLNCSGASCADAGTGSCWYWMGTRHTAPRSSPTMCKGCAGDWSCTFSPATPRNSTLTSSSGTTSNAKASARSRCAKASRCAAACKPTSTGSGRVLHSCGPSSVPRV